MYASRCPNALVHLGIGARSRCAVSAPSLAARCSTSHRLHTSTQVAAIKAHFADAVDSPFHELGLKELWEKGGKVRVRQHVNPLRKEFQVPAPPLAWDHIFQDPTKPLFVDVGCGPGRFLLLLAQRNPDAYNYFGIEIRRTLVERANKWAEALGCTGRVHYKFANATVSLDSMLASYPGPLQYVTVQFPDPHFKKRHRKRRIVQPELVQAVCSRMVPGGQVFLQSDVLHAAASMRDDFERHAGDTFRLSPLHNEEGNVFFVDESEAESEPEAAAGSGPSPASNTEDEDSTSVSSSFRAGAAGTANFEDWAVTSSSAASTSSSGEGSRSSCGGSDYSSTSSTGSSDGTDVGERHSQKGSQEGGEFVSRWKEAGWLRDNPLGLPTERELLVNSEGGSVYRVLLVKQ